MIRSLLVAISLTFVFAFSPDVQAAPKKTKKENFAAPAPELSMRDQALAESVNSGKNQKSASDAQVESGVLRLKDPRPEALARTWKYFAAFSAQQFQTEGTASNDFSSFDLSENNSTLMPGIEVGVLSPAMNTENFVWHVGARGQGSFASQAVNARIQSSGYVLDDARLNSTLLSVGPMVTVAWNRYEWLALTFVPEFGSMTYTQTSSNNFGKFSKSAGYKALSFGLDVRLAPKWSVFTEYSQRELNSDNQLALQKDNFELGTKVTW